MMELRASTITFKVMQDMLMRTRVTDWTSRTVRGQHARTQEAPMRTATQNSIAERLGRWLGHGWRGYVRREGQAVAWLAARGVPKALATAGSWAVKLTVVAALLYVSFWIALLCIGFAVAAWNGALHDEDMQIGPFEEYEDPSQFIDYDPNPYNDITHHSYTDD
ncbi:hypothetical protein U769_22640 [Pseudomonas aeruginosa MTB-1]|nr:hypothetical protein U769_22640 [Pseudomonas aeruginosa MTB-1]